MLIASKRKKIKCSSCKVWVDVRQDGSLGFHEGCDAVERWKGKKQQYPYLLHVRVDDELKTWLEDKCFESNVDQTNRMNFGTMIRKILEETMNDTSNS